MADLTPQASPLFLAECRGEDAATEQLRVWLVIAWYDWEPVVVRVTGHGARSHLSGRWTPEPGWRFGYGTTIDQAGWAAGMSDPA